MRETPFALHARLCRKGRHSLKLFAWRAFGRARPAAIREDEDAIRSELFSIERLEQHAQSLASQPTCPCRADRGQVARRAPARQRARLAGRLSLDRGGGRCRPHDHAGRGMAFGQFPSRGAAGSRGPHRPAPGLLSPASQAQRGAAGRLSAGVRPGLGLRGPYRQPFRSRDADALRARLPDGPAAHASASCGPSRSRSASSWSRTCAARPAASSTGARHANRPTSSPIACWG